MKLFKERKEDRNKTGIKEGWKRWLAIALQHLEVFEDVVICCSEKNVNTVLNVKGSENFRPKKSREFNSFKILFLYDREELSIF